MFEEEKALYDRYVASFGDVSSLGELHAPPRELVELLEESDRLLARRRAAAVEAEAAVLDRFGRELAYLELLLAVGIGLGQTMLDEVEGGTDGTTDQIRGLLAVTTELWRRGIAIAEEILALLKAGFTGAALARWRTLYELGVVALLVGSDPRTEAFNEFFRYQERDVLRVTRDWKTLNERFPEGSMLLDNYGWADSIVAAADPDGYGRTDRRKRYGPSFADMQRVVEQAIQAGVTRRERQLYGLANGVIHGSWLVGALGARQDRLAPEPEASLRTGFVAAASGTSRSFWALTGTLTEVAEFAGATVREREHNFGEVLIAAVHRSLGETEDPKRFI